MELIQEHSICELLIKNISEYHTFYSQATKTFAAQVCMHVCTFYLLCDPPSERSSRRHWPASSPARRTKRRRRASWARRSSSAWLSTWRPPFSRRVPPARHRVSAPALAGRWWGHEPQAAGRDGAEEEGGGEGRRGGVGGWCKALAVGGPARCAAEGGNEGGAEGESGRGVTRIWDLGRAPRW